MTRNTPAISAIVCTHNRERYLDGSIGSLRRQSFPTEAFEIILVDNRSSDGTAEWCRNTARDALNLRYVFEPTLGLNHARNTGWREARGELVAYLDDDAVADGNWLERLVEKFREYGSTVAAMGGKVEPLWEAPPPSWLTPRLWPLLSVLDWDINDLVLNDTRYFVGANMAFRKSALEKVGGFHGDLDRKGATLLSNGEVHMKRLLEDAGYATMYTPHAKVAHSVPPTRMTKTWFRRRHYWQGLSDVVMERLHDASPPHSSRLRRAVRQTRGTLTLFSAGLCQLPGWIIRHNTDDEFAWYYQLGRMAAGWSEILSH